MIKYRLKSKFAHNFTPQWKELQMSNNTMASLDFGHIEYMIDGKIYRKMSKSFIEAYTKHKMWANLTKKP